MKITENINLGGLIFTIDEDALLKLQNYLNSIERYFGAKEERDEILTDIEARIAELFQSQLNKTKEVVSLADVDQIIEVLGLPEDFLSDGSNKNESTNYFQSTSSGRLFRDPDNQIIGGVCSGLGHYFNADPVIIRVLFVILTFFAAGGILLYIVLWVVLPPAINFSDKIEMKSHRVNTRITK
jgi:phage shock protein PspC (stress-responsive transcriptional regulator)